MAKLAAILEKYEGKSGALIQILQELQADKGYLPADDLKKVSRGTGIPLSEIYSVATFYSQFALARQGRHAIRICKGTACHVKGAQQVLAAIREELGVKEDGPTEDYRFTVETVACLGSCFLAPVITIDEEYFGKLTPEKAVEIIKGFKG
ncbi:MAG: NAD(P)H-dependent oxidoreductase subunit E [Actinomycetota bacterium]